MYFSISISPQSPHAGETPAPHSNGCARLQRTYQQRLLQVRAPPARRRARRPRTQVLGMRAGHPRSQAQGETPALPGGAWFTHAARRLMPKPRRGFQALSEGFSPQSPQAGKTPAPHSSSWVRAPPGRISAASAPGARASGAQTGETPALPGGAWFNHAAQRYKS